MVQFMTDMALMLHDNKKVIIYIILRYCIKNVRDLCEIKITYKYKKYALQWSIIADIRRPLPSRSPEKNYKFLTTEHSGRS